MRPLATVLLLIGVDDVKGPQLFKVDCAGHYLPFFAAASGSKEQEAVNFLEKHLEETKECELDDAIRIAITCIGSVCGSDFRADEVEVAIVDNVTGNFRTLKKEEIEGHLNVLADSDM